jgi:hypothetical protein
MKMMRKLCNALEDVLAHLEWDESGGPAEKAYDDALEVLATARKYIQAKQYDKHYKYGCVKCKSEETHLTNYDVNGKDTVGCLCDACGHLILKPE